jgi:hypothetical protein
LIPRGRLRPDPKGGRRRKCGLPPWREAADLVSLPSSISSRVSGFLGIELLMLLLLLGHLAFDILKFPSKFCPLEKLRFRLASITNCFSNRKVPLGLH